MLDKARATARRNWAWAQAWLFRELHPSEAAARLPLRLRKQDEQVCRWITHCKVWSHARGKQP
jgi:hypothetical protein